MRPAHLDDEADVFSGRLVRPAKSRDDTRGRSKLGNDAPPRPTPLSGSDRSPEPSQRPLPDHFSVVHLLAPCEAGGLETVVRGLAVGQRDRGHTVRVAAVIERRPREHPFVTSLRDAGIATEVLAIPDRAYLRERAWVVELCRRWRPSIVHTHGFRPDVVDAPAARRLGVPTITTVHGFTGGGWKLALYERVQRLAFRRFDAVVAVSHALGESLASSGISRDRIHVVPNACSGTTPSLDRSAARRLLSLPDDRFVVGWVGRLSREKGADVLVDAMAHLRGVPLSVSVLGDGPDRESLMARAHAIEAGNRITWHGVVRDAAATFRAFDVLALSSRTEGCPLVLLEAMAAGIPIVATRVGGVPDILSASEAILVPPEDPPALATALLDTFRDRSAAESRAGAARARLQTEFHPDRCLAEYDVLYRQIANARSIAALPGAPMAKYAGRHRP